MHDLVCFYGSMTALCSPCMCMILATCGDGRGKFNRNRVALSPSDDWSSTSPSAGTCMLHCWPTENAGRWIRRSLPSQELTGEYYDCTYLF